MQVWFAWWQYPGTEPDCVSCPQPGSFAWSTPSTPRAMAAHWIKLEHPTPDKPEVFKIADALGIDPDTVLGKLVRFWIWCDQQSLDGNDITVTETALDRITHLPGFSAALRNVGWLQARSGSLAVPHFDRHNGQSAKARALANLRVAAHRDKNKHQENAEAKVTPPPLQKALPEEEAEEEEDQKPSVSVPPNPQGSGGEGYSDSFEAFWNAYPKKTGKGAAWQAWRKIKHRPASETLIAAVKRHQREDQWRRNNGRFIPLPATWLNQRRWEDEGLEPAAAAPQPLQF
jgi:hypothetical protein